MVHASKKIESAFKETVQGNKQYFNHLNDFGNKMTDENSAQRIDVKYSDINKNFYKDVDLEEKLMQKLIHQHLKREGFSQSLKTYISESSTSASEKVNPVQSVNDQIGRLDEIIQDLNDENTESALFWVDKNMMAINKHGGNSFIFKLHQANLLKLFQKAVDIHFELNYLHICENKPETKDN